MNETAGFLGILVLLLAILAGVNVMVALGVVGFLGLSFLVGIEPASTVLSNVAFSIVNGFHYSVVPMFLLMGFFAMQAGIGRDLFDAGTKWLGRIPGGLAVAATSAAAAFGAASGSSVGTATLFTKLALPEMVERGYDKGLASGSIAIAGTLAVLIPPSALVVIYGILTNSSIAGLLVAGFLPGVVFAVLLVITIVIQVKLRPSLAPRYTNPVSLYERFRSLRLVGPLLLVIAAIIGGLYTGIFTPTEAGGIGALVTLIMAVVRKRSIRGVEIGKALIETVNLSAMIFAIIIGALIFSRFLALSGATDVLGDMISTEGMSVWMVVLLVTLVYLLLGTLMDPPALLAVSLPITHPVMMQLGFDPIWFGIYVVVLAEIGAVTPPVGLNCYVVKGAAGDLVELSDIFRGLWPFILASFVMLGILLLFPELVLFLPQSMKG
ncbi:MAG: TRAP transporter large permease [Gammaproteobacteria bacterium]|nr:TRAP transporter large permease [Gammaproteobacteria bacterium]